MGRQSAGDIQVPTKVVPKVRFPTWRQFTANLATVLSRMAVDTFLIIEVRATETVSNRYVQFAQGGRLGFRAEAVSNVNLTALSALSPQQEEQIASLGWQFPTPGDASDPNFSRQWPMPAPFGEVATLAVRTLREVFGVAATSELGYKSFAKSGGDFAQPLLGIDWIAPPRRPTPAAPRTPTTPAAPTMDTLRPLVEKAVRALLNVGEITYDDDGDIPIRFGSAMVFLRLVDGQPPVVQIFSPVIWGIAPSSGLLEAVNDINLRIRYGRVVWTGREVMARMELPAINLSADDIGFACLQLGSIADHFDGDLHQRFGGKTMFETTKTRLN